MYRKPVQKGRSASQFKRRVAHTDRVNLASPLRGGWRL